MPNVKECVTVHIGQAGVQTGMQTWELFTQEHGIQPDGTRVDDGYTDYDPDDSTYASFFHETNSGQHVPRAVFVDTEPTCINDIKVSKMRKLFHPDTLVSYKQDCKSNFFEGRVMASAFKIQETVVDRIRLAVDLCDNPQGFFVFHSVGGGTGSGVGVEVLHDMKDQFDKKAIFQPVIYPSSNYSSCIVEPYNCVFATHFMKDVVDLSIMLDNQAAYSICENNLQIKTPHFSHVNRLIAQCISGATAPLRYETELNATLTEIQQNLVPMPTFRYPIISLAPVRHAERGAHEKFNTPEIITELFDERNCLCEVKRLGANRYVAAVLILRGDGDGDAGDADPRATSSGRGVAKPISFSAAIQTLNSLRNPPSHKTHTRAVKFCPWMEGTGIKLGIVRARPHIPKEFCMSDSKRQGILLGNNTAVRQLFVRQYVRFLRLFYHKAYVWQFIDATGDDDTFLEAKESMRDLIDEYEKLLSGSASVENERVQSSGASTTVRLMGATSRAQENNATAPPERMLHGR